MNPQDYWQKAHLKYSQQDWINKPTIFATQVIQYFPKSGSLLELGAGQGQDSKYFTQLGYQVLATDFSEFALARIQGIKTQICDLSQPLLFRPDSFDIIYSHLALHYFDLDRTRKLFKEIYTILKPGGVFASITNTIDDPEISQCQKIEDDFYQCGDVFKRYFSVNSMKGFTSKFEPIILDSQGETHKDIIKTLIRFVGRKPPK